MPSDLKCVDAPPTFTGNVELLASPLVRKMARERGIDLQGVRGSGPRNSITPEYLARIETPTQATATDYGPVERVPLRGVGAAPA